MSLGRVLIALQEVLQILLRQFLEIQDRVVGPSSRANQLICFAWTASAIMSQGARILGSLRGTEGFPAEAHPFYPNDAHNRALLGREEKLRNGRLIRPPHD